MAVFSINLNIAGRPCAVIGGGAVAERKILTLLNNKAIVTVIAPKLTDKLVELVNNKLLTYKNTCYCPGQLQGFFIVVCATDKQAINAAAAKEAKLQGALVNVVDNPELCDFTVPAQVVRGDFLLTVSTNGKSPEFSRRIKEELLQLYGPEYGTFLDVTASLRNDLKTMLSEPKARKLFWQKVLGTEVFGLMRAGRFRDAEDKIKDAISCFRLKS